MPIRLPITPLRRWQAVGSRDNPRSRPWHGLCSPAGVNNEIVRRHVTVNTSRISYLSLEREPEAAAPVILLIHGSGVNARYWADQLRGLGAARVLAIDLPGHGESDDTAIQSIDHHADVAAGFIGALGAAPVIAVGHSLGGAVALALAARRPAAVQGLVLLSTCARLPAASLPAQWLLPFLPRPVRTALFFMTAQGLLFASSASGRVVGLGMQELRACRPETLARDVAMSRSMNLTAVAKALRVPALVLCGSRDQITPPALSTELHALLAGSRLRIVPGAGHMVLMEAPDVVNREIQTFVDAVARPRRVPHVERRWCGGFRQWATLLPVRYALSRLRRRGHRLWCRVFVVLRLASSLRRRLRKESWRARHTVRRRRLVE
jgi:pimeloyl-ACP methyl ester carboxylesterase